jgi:hypothetical protein
LLSGEHFSVDGTLIQAWAGHKSFVRKDGSDEPGAGGSFKGQTRSNETHESTTDADARLYRKGKTGSELRFMGHTLTDNRHGLIANAVVTTAVSGCLKARKNGWLNAALGGPAERLMVSNGEKSRPALQRKPTVANAR